MPEWIHQRWTRVDFASLPPVNAHLFRAQLQRMRDGKTCSKDDMLVAEMLQTLSDEALSILAELYALRILNHPTEEVELFWGRHQVILLQKFFGAKRGKDFRPFAILSVLLKLYPM
eukprot:3667310-Pyramimonas_sp.AAC.1